MELETEIYISDKTEMNDKHLKFLSIYFSEVWYWMNEKNQPSS